ARRRTGVRLRIRRVPGLRKLRGSRADGDRCCARGACDRVRPVVWRVGRAEVRSLACPTHCRPRARFDTGTRLAPAEAARYVRAAAVVVRPPFPDGSAVPCPTGAARRTAGCGGAARVRTRRLTYRRRGTGLAAAHGSARTSDRYLRQPERLRTDC